MTVKLSADDLRGLVESVVAERKGAESATLTVESLRQIIREEIAGMTEKGDIEARLDDYIEAFGKASAPEEVPSLGGTPMLSAGAKETPDLDGAIRALKDSGWDDLSPEDRAEMWQTAWPQKTWKIHYSSQPADAFMKIGLKLYDFDLAAARRRRMKR